MHPRKLETILAIVERALRHEFPEDFHKRCAYAAFGTRALLSDAGGDAIFMGGDFLAMVMPRDGSMPTLQGFGQGVEQCAHFWVETEDQLIDLGPYFLPQESRYPATKMPAVAWEKAEPLPLYFRYRPLLRFPAHVPMSPEPAIQERSERFVADCRRRKELQAGPVAFPSWVVTGPASVTLAASKRDPWAVGANRFQGWADPASLPF